MRISTTGRADFFLCKGRYDYNHVLQPKETPAALLRGQQVHTILSSMYGRHAVQERAAYLVEQVAAPENAAVKPFLLSFQKEPELLHGQECPDFREVVVDIGDGLAHDFVGHPDRVYVDNDHQMCIDEWKTGRDFNRPEQYLVFTPQLVDYTHALTVLLGKAPLAYYVLIPNVGKARRALAPIDIDVERWKADLWQAASLMDMAQRNVVPWPQFTRGYHCLSCKFEPLCEARIVGGPEAEESVKQEKYVEVQRDN